MSFYLIDDLEQGTDEWRAWRKGVIGASDAPKIMGENPWGSRESLMNEKLGFISEFKGNSKTREGNNLEGDARNSLAKKFKMKLLRSRPRKTQHKSRENIAEPKKTPYKS